MTAFVRAFVVCDDCGAPMDNSTVPSARTIGEALRDAKRLGWVRKRGRRDLCEDCAEAGRDGAQATPVAASDARANKEA